MPTTGLHLHSASIGPSLNQKKCLIIRSHRSLQGRAPGSQGSRSQQILCNFRRDEQQDGSVENAFPQAQVLTKTALRKYSKAKLEEELRRRDLDASGTKVELVDRLHAALTVFLVEEKAAPEAHLAGEDGERKEAQALPPSGGVSESDRVSVSLETDNSLARLLDLTKRELQQALVQRGLPKTGNKTDLAQRLFRALEDARSVLLAEQMEASAELQRQYQEAAASSGFRRPSVEDSTADEDDEEFSKWAAEVESEYEGPEDAAEEDTVGTDMELRETDWRVVNGRPAQMMEMFEHQGTAAAELASEDYAFHQRAERTTSVAAREDQDDDVAVEDSQDIDDDMNPSVTGSRSGRKQQMGPYGEDSDRFDTENELEDGFSFVTDDADGFDSDAEERLAQLDSTRAHVQGRQAERADEADDENTFAPRHRNYQNLSARSPDDLDFDLEEEDEGDGDAKLLDAASGLGGGALVPDGPPKVQDEEEMVAGSARGAAAVSGAANDSDAAFLGRSSPPSSAPPPSSSMVSIPGGGKGKGMSLRQGRAALTHAGSQDAAALVVASQGISTLDNQTALEWMRTRLPEAAQLINPGSSLTQPVLSPKGTTLAEQIQGIVAEDTPEEAQDSSVSALKQDVPTRSIREMEAETAQSGAHDVLEQEAMTGQTEEEEEATEARGSGVGTSEEDTLAFTSREEEAQTAERTTQFAKQDGMADQALPPAVQDSSVGAQMQEDAIEEDEAVAAEAMEGGAALEAAVDPKKLPDDGTVLETDMPVQFQGLELAQEDLQTAPAQPEAGAMDIPSDEDQLAEDSPSKEDTVAAADDVAGEEVLLHVTEAQTVTSPHLLDDDSPAVMDIGSIPIEDPNLLSAESMPATAHMADSVGEALESAAGTDAQESVQSVPTLEPQPLAPALSRDVVRIDMHGSGVQLPQQKEMEALQVEMKQKQEAITVLQNKMLAAENAGDDNVARIASLQAALVELQSQQLAWQRDNLSERLAALLEAASQASLNTSTKDELKGQLEAMRGELTQLEADLSSRDTEAAKLSSALADARSKLGGAESAPGGRGDVSSGRIPGSIQVKLDMDLGELAATGSSDTQAKSATKPGHPFPSVKPATSISTAQTNSSKPRPADNKKASFDAGSMVTAGLAKLVSGLFGLGRKPKKDSEADEQDRNRG